MKDELRGCVIREFVGLRPKCYSVLSDGYVDDKNVLHRDIMSERRKSKGVKNISLKII